MEVEAQNRIEITKSHVNDKVSFTTSSTGVKQGFITRSYVVDYSL